MKRFRGSMHYQTNTVIAEVTEMLDKSTVMLGTSAAMRAIEQEIDVAANCSAKVLITGESGVGKELVARLIHEGSARRANKFVAINCAGLPDSLLESELFGHVRGSFTGAYRDKKGWLEAAHGGTIFLDEVGEMSLRMQAMLLRFLETGEIQRVGSERPLPPLDVRVIAATHRNLAECVKDRTFREDLYYRLNVVHIEVPPLRDRRGDIPVLLNHFLSTFSTTHRLPRPEVAADALHRLATYDWPGNVRELKNVAERLVVGSRSGRIESSSLPARHVARDAAPQPGGQASGRDAANSAAESAPLRAPDEGAGVVLVRGARAVHESRHHQGRCAGARAGRSGAHARQLQDARQGVQHGPARLQALPELPADLRVPRLVPPVPHDGRLRRGGQSAAGMRLMT